MSIEFNDVFYKYRTDKFQLELNEIEIESNSITCLIGPNGMGKTTLLYLLSNLYKPQRGTIIIDGLNYINNSFEIYKNSYFSVDFSSFYQNLNSYTNLRLQCIYRQVSEKRINEVLEIVGLENDKKKFKKFSTGMKQKLNIASALLHKPKLIVLDEPFNGLDPGSVITLKNIFTDLNTSNGTTIVMTTHLLKEADSFCTNYCIMNYGSIVESNKIDKDFANLESRYKSVFQIN